MFGILHQHAAKAVCGILVLCLISACDTGSDTPRSTRATAGSSSTTQGALAPISALPPGSDARPLLPGQSDTVYTPDGLPALSPARGVNADQLFAEKLKDEKARFDRLERAVADMRREFDSIKPAIIRLSAVESDMQELLTQLQTLTGTGPSTMSGYTPEPLTTQNVPTDIPMEPMADVDFGDSRNEPDAPAAISSPPSVAPAPPEPASVAAHPPIPPPIVVADGANAVTSIRSGNHDGVARLVLDLKGPGQYALNLDTTEHILTIELPGVAWGALPEGKFAKSPLLQSWSATAADKGGSVVAVQLSGAASVVKEMTLPGTHGSGSRIVIDLK